jgi:hypothetical protein
MRVPSNTSILKVLPQNSPGETEEGYAEISGKKACPLSKIKIGYLHNIKNTAVPKCILVY